jgi:dephospho-CoA kinase
VKARAAFLFDPMQAVEIVALPIASPVKVVATPLSRRKKRNELMSAWTATERRRYNKFQTMPAIGITGGIATGKTSFVACLREIVPEARFFDADVAARELADNDPEAKRAIDKEFGPEAFLPNGGLNRERIRTIVFADAGKKGALEQILHPRIRRQWSLEAESHRNSAKLFFADIPLLYETSGETLCDRVVVVACSPRIQLERLRARMGDGESEAQQMIAAQMPLTEKITRADHVVWNNGGGDGLKEQAKLLVDLWRRNEF